MRIPCECYSPRWEEVEEATIEYDRLGVPESITTHHICFVCDKSWMTRYLIGNLEELIIDTTEELN